MHNNFNYFPAIMTPNPFYEEILEEVKNFNGDTVSTKKFLNSFRIPKITPSKKDQALGIRELKRRIKEKNKENPSSISYYFHNFRYYFSGFSVAMGIFLILFLMGVINISKFQLPQRMQPLLSQTWVKAFGDLEQLSHNAQEVLYHDHGLMQPLEVFSITSKQLPKLPKQLKVLKKVPTPLLSQSVLEKKLNIHGIKLQKYQDYNLYQLNLRESLEGNMLNLDFTNQTASLSIKNQKKPTDAQLDKLLENYGIDMKYYGSLISSSLLEEELSNVAQGIFPRKLDGYQVYRLADRELEGIKVIFNPINQHITTIQDIDLNRYLGSNYPLSIEKKGILDQLKNQWVQIDAPSDASKLNKGKIVYVVYQNYLLPALHFSASSSIDASSKDFFVLLY